MSKSYQEKLKDPRWQKKRLEVFNRDGFACCKCNDTETTLHVHHLKYTGYDPWDAPIDDLEALCEDCHNVVTNYIGKDNYLVRASKCANDNHVFYFLDIRTVDGRDLFGMLTIFSDRYNFILLRTEDKLRGLTDFIKPFTA